MDHHDRFTTVIGFGMKDLKPERRPGSAGWGGGSMDEAVFDAIRDILPEGKTVLELGSGWGSGQLVKHYTVYSIEHDNRWTDMYHWNYIYAPLKEHKAMKRYASTRWYDADVLRKEIPKIQYDLLLIDGPPGELRGGLSKYFDLFHTQDVPLIFDDLHRELDMRLCLHIASKLQKEVVIYGCGQRRKQFGIINDPRLKL